MSTSSRKPKTGDRGRTPYRLTAKQLMRIIAAGIIADHECVELWDGILFELTKDELHNQVVMLTADVLRSVIPDDQYHIREEKSTSDGTDTLVMPDLTVARGALGWLRPRPPELSELALVVEVDHHTNRADRVDKYRRYAERRIPVYWIIKAKRGFVLVFDTPQCQAADPYYARMQRYAGADEIPIVIDGHEVGRVTVDQLFPEPLPGA